jgi:hypothetical protein
MLVLSPSLLFMIYSGKTLVIFFYYFRLFGVYPLIEAENTKHLKIPQEKTTASFCALVTIVNLFCKVKIIILQILIY